MKLCYITDPKVVTIPVVECCEPLIDLKDYQELRYGEPPECEFTKDDYTKIRKAIFEKLSQAQADLPKGWRFRIYEGFRSIHVQQMLFEQEFKRVIVRYPHESHEKQFYETTRLVSPVILLDGSRNIPAHNTGGAVDVEIITENGQLIDMGMAAKDWYLVDPELCLTDCDIINKKAKQNRRRLLEVMQAHGFVNYPTEWWHFSYGDRYWAYQQSMEHAIYGSADELVSEI